MQNQHFTGQEIAGDQQGQSGQDPVDPKKPQGGTDDVASNKDNIIVNTGEQNEIVNEEGIDTAIKDESRAKGKGYEEGTRNDSLTEPEYRDSDDQLEFPDEEGK